MNAHDRFVDLIHALVKDESQRPAIPGDGHLLGFDGRIFHLGLDATRNEIVISTMVYRVDEASGDVYPALIADFNSYHLFNGGYRLSHDPESSSLYVSQRKSLTSLEHFGLHDFFVEFISRCVSCTRWYVGQVGLKPPSERSLAYLATLHEQVDALADIGMFDILADLAQSAAHAEQHASED